MKIKLSQESIDFATYEGTEIFKNSRSLTFRDTLEKKIGNSLVGAFGQQAFIEGTGGRRVTEEECPHFAYDVEASNKAIQSYCGWSLPLKTDLARVEVKVRPVEGRSWISFNDQTFRHVTRCAASGMLDYVVFYGIKDIDLKKHEADVGLLGIISAQVLAMPDLRRPSLYVKGDSFLNKNRINDRNLGCIFL